jgi:hypothetical protein
MAGSWLVQQKGHEQFVTPEELKALARSGKLGPGDLVYHPTLGRWLYAREVEEVSGELSTALTVAPSTGLAGPPPQYNDSAVAGFTLGVLSVVPVFGIACALVGLPLSVRGLRRARRLGGTDRRLAVAGMALGLVSLAINGGATLLALLF